MTKSPILRWVLLSLVIAGGVIAPIAAIWITLHTVGAHPGVDPYYYLDDGMPASLVLVPLALLMVVRRPDNSITWLFAALVFFGGMQQLTGAYSVEALWVSDREPLPGGVTAQFGQALFQMWWTVAMVSLIALFPTGRPLSRRWVWLPWILLLLFVVAPLNDLVFQQFPFAESEALSPSSVSGIEGLVPGVSPELVTVLGLAAAICGVLAVGGALSSVVLRYRRSSGVERIQIRWFFYAVVATVLVFVVTGVIAELLGGETAVAESSALVNDYLLNPWMLGSTIVVGSMALAVLRFGLYEIDRIVSRTVSYGLVVALLIGVVVVVALIAGTRFEEPWVVAATTLGVAALFNPLRRRVQGWVDRRFNRSRYDAERVMDGFAASLRDRVDADGVVDGWLGVVEDTMQPGSVGLWVRG